VQEVKRYNGIEEDPEGVYVLYTDAVKMQREAFMAGCEFVDTQDEIYPPGEYEAEAARRYKEET
jgi:hypothetical protein